MKWASEEDLKKHEACVNNVQKMCNKITKSTALSHSGIIVLYIDPPIYPIYML